VISLSPEVSAQSRITAKHLKAIADSLSVVFASNAELATVKSFDVDTMGEASAWTYTYFSFDTSGARNSKSYSFIAQDGQVTFDDSGAVPWGPFILLCEWMDSDSALAIAQHAWGSDIKRRFPSCAIIASLWQLPAPPWYCAWHVDYRCPDSVRSVYIDATSGEVLRRAAIVTSVELPRDQTLPIRMELCQNYPNPFNPTTTICYSLPRKSTVQLRVFDTLGRHLAALVQGEQDAGYHEVKFFASGLSSGAYFYRLACGNSVQTRKMILSK